MKLLLSICLSNSFFLESTGKIFILKNNFDKNLFSALETQDSNSGEADEKVSLFVESRDECPTDENFYCEQQDKKEICWEWNCPDGVSEHSYCTAVAHNFRESKTEKHYRNRLFKNFFEN